MGHSWGVQGVGVRRTMDTGVAGAGGSEWMRRPLSHSFSACQWIAPITFSVSSG